MNDILFWINWDRNNRRYYTGLFILLSIVFIGIITVNFVGPDVSYDWYIQSNLNTLSVPLDGGPIYMPDSAIHLDLRVINQNFIGSNLILNPISSYLFLSLFILGVLICLTVITYLSRFWYIMSIGLFTLMLGSIGLERLGWFGFEDMTPAVILFLSYVPLTYYFNSINTNVDIKKRLGALIGVTILLGVLIYNFSTVETPFLFLANYSFLPSLIITIILILLVSHEIVYFILSISTYESKGLNSKNTGHFLILSVIYLVNVLLIYLRNESHMSWDIIYINPFLLLTLSVFLGIWGMKSREVLYKNILSFYPFTAYLFIGMALVAGATILFHFVQGSDAVLEAIEDVIVFGHFGFGLMFLLYIIVNFISLLLKNLPVYKIAYKEDNFPYFTARLAGMIFVAGFYFLSSQAALYQSIAGYYNGIGDVYYQNGNIKLSKAFYTEGSIYGYNNHKSNYMLGILDEKDAKKLRDYEKSTKKNPTEYSFVNLGVQYEANNRYFDAIFAYQEGLKVFPASNTLKNNLALLYSRTNIDDSTFYYLNESLLNDDQSNIKLSNLLGFSALKAVPTEFLDKIHEVQEVDRFDVAANMLANVVQFGRVDEIEDLLLPNSTDLNIHTFAYLNNLGVWSSKTLNSVYVDNIDKYINDQDNDEYRDELIFIKAVNLYNMGEVNLAFETLNMVANEDSDRAGYFNYVGAIWSATNDQYMLSLDYLDKCEIYGFTRARSLAAIIKNIIQNEQTVVDLSGLRNTTDSLYINSIMYIIDNKGTEANKVKNFDDSRKHLWLSMNKGQTGYNDRIVVARSIGDERKRIEAELITLILHIGDLNTDFIKSELLNLIKRMSDLNDISIIEKHLHKLPGQVVHDITEELFHDNGVILKPEFTVLQKLNSNEQVDPSEVFAIARKNAFAEELVMDCLKALHAADYDDQQIYDLLLQSIKVNVYSEVLIKAYIDQCLKMGYTSYAESALIRLIDILSKDEYAEYERSFDVRKDELDREFDNW